MLAYTFLFPETETSVCPDMDTLSAWVVHNTSNLAVGGVYSSCLQPRMCRKLQAVFLKTGCRWQGLPSPPKPMEKFHITNKVIWGLAIYEPSLIALALLPMITAGKRVGSKFRRGHGLQTATPFPFPCCTQHKIHSICAKL